jgi:hypothetical protein
MNNVIRSNPVTSNIHEEVISDTAMSNEELAEAALTGYMLGMDDFAPATALLEVVWSNPEVFSTQAEGNLNEFLDALVRAVEGTVEDNTDPHARLKDTLRNALEAHGFSLASDT